ncbi:outer membrane beta-barrel family protein [Emticicia sp. 21SJ11W-3]|uniref:outer membrane beta-barrel family protein n=1 Tax=Emticicia sp. 21SJ11W-3 TaxID=2916755 RepID=UPI00209FBDD6|nr:outer membrane beta-barrel family protein [Emticicia sp. 21SJ11W-3]UTA68146.1 TonB-dependent receptor family protein [Emticicia sp. 21SJ11W-3]
MNKFISILSLAALVGFSAAAQFPGGPGGMGGQRGDGNGRPNNAQQTPQLNLDGNAPKGNSKISGFVVDEAVTTAVEFANVALYNKATNKVVDGTMADEKGKFSLTRVAAGEYKLVISFIGYADKVIDNIKVEKGKDIDLGVIKLSTSAKQLDEVTVTAEKSMIEEKVDRLVYNAEKDITSKGGDAADVLRKVPLLTVDLDGNVSLRGTSNIRVLINNKPSTIIASSIADALKMIPSDLIKSVEVITSPSAKYDAEGSGGIINIITKKSSIEGLTLNLDSGVGVRGSNLGLNGNIRKGKLGISMGGGGRAFYNKAATSLDQSTLRGGNTVLTKQTADAFDNGLFGRYNLGFDYDIAKNQSLTAGINLGTRNFIRTQDYTTSLYTNNVFNSTAYRNVDSKDLSSSIDVNLDYIRTFKPSQEWSVSTQYSKSNLKNNFLADLLNESGGLTSRQKNLNGNTNQEFTLQTDFQTPIKQNQVFEVGVKGIFRQVNSDFSYLFAGPTGDFATDARNPSGLLDYSQNIASGYMSYTYSTKNKYVFKVGARYEYTTIEAKDQVKDINIPSYGNLVPSVNVSKTIGATTLKAAYNKRIQRPGLQQLNPNFNAANPQNITIGNPSLRPEITDNFELSASANIKKVYLNASVFGRQTNNSILRLSAPSDTLAGAIVTTFENIGKQQMYGTNIFGNLNITPKWSVNAGIDLYYSYLEGMAQGSDGVSSLISNDGVVIGGRLQTQIQLKNGWGIQGFSFFRGNQIQLQGTQGSFYMYSLGFRKDFKNKKGSLGLATENFLGGIKVKTTLNSAQFNQVSVNNIYNQNVRLTFSYKIGNMRMVEKKTKSVKNDDVKAGESNNMNN